MSDTAKSLKGVKFVYFDMGNVLFTFSGGLESLAKLFGKPIEEVKNYWLIKDNDICRGILDPQDFWKEVKLEFNYSGPDINFVDFWVQHFSKIQKGHDLAYKLSKDFHLGLLTNAYPTVVERVIETDLMPNIRWVSVVVSCNYGLVKPERELFDVALKKTGFKSSEVILIDDIQENCDKATENGWRSILFK